MSNKTTSSPTSNKAWKTAMRALDQANSTQAKAARVVATAVDTITDTVLANASSAHTVSVSGAGVGDAVIVNPGAGIQGLCVTGFVDSAGSVTYVLSNPTTAPITITGIDFDIMVLRKGVN